MKNYTLVIMAAGRGSRFGGLKQIEEIDGRGHRLIDYSVFDAVRVGFDKIVFIVNPHVEEKFRKIGSTYMQKYDISVDFALQTAEKMPCGYTLPTERKKPWGTAHAVGCLEGVVCEPFALINADDFYGRSSLSKIFNFISSNNLFDHSYAMVGYRLGNTLSDHGGVSRGICKVENGLLLEITERKGIRKIGEEIYFEDENGRTRLDHQSIVSVNLWGFSPDIISECNLRFEDFLNENLSKNPNECEFYLPSVVSSLLNEGRSTVSVIESSDLWCGMTYRDDLKKVREMLLSYTDKGIYPKNL